MQFEAALWTALPNIFATSNLWTLKKKITRSTTGAHAIRIFWELVPTSRSHSLNRAAT
jgi:hypothetical protein